MRARLGSSRRRVRARLSSHSAWKVRSLLSPYAAAAFSRAVTASRPRPAAVGLGAVLFTDRARDRGQRRQHLAGGVHHLKSADQVTGEQPRVPEVVLRAGDPLGVLGGAEDVQRTGQVGNGLLRGAALEVQVAAVEQRPPQVFGCALQQVDGLGEVVECRGRGADALVKKGTLRPDEAPSLAVEITPPQQFPAPGQGRVGVAGLGLDEGGGQLDPGAQVRVVGLLACLDEQRRGPVEVAGVDTRDGALVQPSRVTHPPIMS